jgi:hypothetical protein
MPDVVCGIVMLDPPMVWPVEVASTATTQVPGTGAGVGVGVGVPHPTIVSEAITGTMMTKTARSITSIQRYVRLFPRYVIDIHHSPIMSCTIDFLNHIYKTFR